MIGWISETNFRDKLITEEILIRRRDQLYFIQAAFISSNLSIMRKLWKPEAREGFYWASVGNIRSAKKKALSEIFKPEPVSDIIRPTGSAFLAWTMTLALMFPDELITGNSFLSDFFLIVKVLVITSSVFTTVLWQFFSKPDKFLDNSFYPHVWVFQESSSVWDGMLLTSFLIVKVLQTVFKFSEPVQILNSTVLVPRESGRVWHRSECWVRWNANLSPSLSAADLTTARDYKGISKLTW